MIEYIPNVAFLLGLLLVSAYIPNTWSAVIAVFVGGLLIYVAGILRGMIEAAKRINK